MYTKFLGISLILLSYFLFFKMQVTSKKLSLFLFLGLTVSYYKYSTVRFQFIGTGTLFISPFLILDEIDIRTKDYI